MSLDFSHSVGYHGYCKLNDTIMLCTGGNISLSQDPIMGSGVWGAGYQNVAPIAYAWNYLNLEGSSNFELTTGNLWETLNTCCIEGRGKPDGYPITLLPDGNNGFNGRGWCYNLSFDASEGSAVSGSFNFKGDPAPKDHSGIIAGGEAGLTEVETGNGGSVTELAGATLIPYWRTTVKTDAGKMKDIVNWSCSYNSDMQMLKCCNLDEGTPVSPLSPDYALLGEVNCDGNYTIFTISGNFAPGDFHRKRTNLKFVLGLGGEGSEGTGNNPAIYTHEFGTITIPRAIIQSGSTSMTTGASYVSAEFSFNGLGDGKNAIMKMERKKEGGI